MALTGRPGAEVQAPAENGSGQGLGSGSAGRRAGSALRLWCLGGDREAASVILKHFLQIPRWPM